MFFIDIAVPRDIDPAINKVANAYCYDIDDLNAVIDANRREREEEALRAQAIIEEEVGRYLRWFGSLSAVPTVKALRQAFQQTGERELEKILHQSPRLSSRESQRMQRLVHNLVNKLLHSPSTALRQLAEDGNGKLYLEAISTLFDLPVNAPTTAGEDPAEEDEERPADDNVLPFSS